MKNTLGKAFLKTLLYSTSAMALSMGAANAGAFLNEHLIGDDPFVNGDKSINFELIDCAECGTASLGTPIGGGDFGFRIVFSGASAQSVSVTNTFDTSLPDATQSRTLGFTVSADPMFRIIGASMKADAGVTAEYSYIANGENDFGGSASAEASGRVDLGLTTTTFPLNLMASLEGMISQGGLTDMNMPGDDNKTGMPMDMGDGMPPMITYNFLLNWDLLGSSECMESFSGMTLATCSATGGAVINSIEVRFKQQIPEPASLALFGLGLAGLGALQRRRRKTSV